MLRELNRLPDNRVAVRDTLMIPSRKHARTYPLIAQGRLPIAPDPSSIPVKTTAQAARKVHTVAKGESLWSIARHYDVEVATLTQSNGISKSASLRQGQKLVLQKVAAPSTQTAKAAPLHYKVKRGDSLADPLERSGYFPPLLIQIVAIGEQTGKLDELLLNAADTFDTDADAAINRFMAIFPAVLILLLAVVIGFIIAAALLPIVTMSMGAGGT